MNCPGLNHEYQLGYTFYTLQSDSGCYLSHPDQYRDGPGKQDVCYITHEMKKIQAMIQYSLTKDWRCAWVVYSLEDLRRVYQYISSRFALEPEKERPRHPCIGEFIRGEYGMVTVKGLRKMSPIELIKSKEAAKRAYTTAHSTQTAAQLKMQLMASYSEFHLPSLPDVSEKKQDVGLTSSIENTRKLNQEPPGTSQSKNNREDATEIEGGLFNYVIPNIS